MNFRELKYGTAIYDECNRKLAYSREAAKSGITQVICSRIAMAAPGMCKDVNKRCLIKLFVFRKLEIRNISFKAV